jgi:hypothetical protein
MTFKMLWVGTSTNDKTGNIPQGYVGEDREQTEKSCEGCPLRKGGCYHWQGNARGAQASMQRAHAKNPDSDRYTLKTALSKSRRMARYVRGAVGGDPWVFDRETVQGWLADIEEQGLAGMLLYTHFAADKGEHLKGLAMASVHSLEEADDRIDEGWRAAMVADFKTPDSKRSTLNKVPTWNGEEFTTPKGRKGIVCPAQYKAVDCNSCGLCNAQRVNGEAAPMIVFLKH